MGQGEHRSRVLVGLPSWTLYCSSPCVGPGGGGDDDDRAKDGQGLCIVYGGCLIDNAEDGNVETATGWVPYKVRNVLYVGGRPEEVIILSGGTTMRTDVPEVRAVNEGWTALLDKGQATGGGGE